MPVYLVGYIATFFTTVSFLPYFANSVFGNKGHKVAI